MRSIGNNKSGIVEKMKIYLPFLFVIISKCLIGQIVTIEDTISQPTTANPAKIYVLEGTEISNNGALVYGDFIYINNNSNKENNPKKATKQKNVIKEKRKKKKVPVYKPLKGKTAYNYGNETIFINFQSKKSLITPINVKYILQKTHQKLYFCETDLKNNIFESQDSFIQKTYTKKNIIRPPPYLFFSSVLQFI